MGDFSGRLSGFTAAGAHDASGPLSRLLSLGAPADARGAGAGDDDDDESAGALDGFSRPLVPISLDAAASSSTRAVGGDDGGRRGEGPQRQRLQEQQQQQQRQPGEGLPGKPALPTLAEGEAPADPLGADHRAWAGPLAGAVSAARAAGAAAGWLLLGAHEVELGERVGAGASGETSRGRWRGLDVAVKAVRIARPVDLECFLREVTCWSALDHPGIVRFRGALIQASPPGRGGGEPCGPFGSICSLSWGAGV
jgi:hypothetical protein